MHRRFFRLSKEVKLWYDIYSTELLRVHEMGKIYSKYIKKKIVRLRDWFGALSWKKKALCIVVLLVIAGVVYKGVRGSTPNYSFDTVTSQTVTEVVTETGNVSLAGEYDIPSPSTGILTELYVQNGDTVAAGQKLFTVTSTATPQQKASALASYMAAKSALDAANAGLFALQSTMFSAWKVYTDIAENSTYQNSDSSPNTGNRVLTPFTTVQDNWLAAEANYKNQQSVIASAQAAASNTYLAYLATQDSVVTAPVAGSVQNLNGVVGSLVSAAASTGQGAVSPVCILSNGQTFTVKTAVNEVDINKIKVGDTVAITFDAIKDKTFNGKIIQADEFGTNAQGVINYNVFASVDDGNGFIKPGMTANLSIDTNTHENVLTVVNAAVRPYKGAKAVQIVHKGKTEYVTVTTGIKGFDRTELTSGVTLGEKVIIGNTTSKTPSPLPGN
jgi:multidrug efflux pump subunit AcrA (membrane-fusion protein)